MTDSRPTPGRLAVVAAAFIVLLVSSLPFAMTLEHGFQQDDFATLSQFFAADGTFELPRRPSLPFPSGFIPFWTHLADSYVWGADAFGHHLTNLLIHVISAMLMFAVVRRLLPRALTAATFAAVFFALSALHLNAIGFVSGRDVALATMLGLAAVLAALRREPAPVLATLAYVAALLCHSAALTVPLLALLLAAAAPDRLTRARFLRVFVPLLVIGALYVASVRLMGERIWHTDQTLAALGGNVLPDTLARLLLPLNEAITNPSKAPILRWLVLAVVLPLAVIVLFARRVVPLPALALGLGWIVLALLPVLSSARLEPDLTGSRVFYGVVPGVAFLLACIFFGDTLTANTRSDPSAHRRARARALLISIVYSAALGFCVYKNMQAYAGADRLVKHVRTAALEAAAARTSDTRIVITDPPERYAGAPVLATGLSQALARPFCDRREAAQIVVARSRDPEPILAALAPPHPPVTVLWMNHRGLDPSRPFVAVSPELPRSGAPMPPYLPPRYVGTALDSWTPLNGLSGRVSPEGFEGTVADRDAWFVSSPLVIPLHWIAAVRVQLRVQDATVTAPVPVDLFWTDLRAPDGFTASRVVRLMLPPDGSLQTLTFRLPTAGRTDLYLARLRLDPPSACEVGIKEITLLPGPLCPGRERVAAAWSGLSFGDWVASPETTLERSADGLALRTAGDDPYAVSPALDLDAGAVRAIEVTMRVDAKTDQATLYWKLDTPEGFCEAHSRTFKVHVGDGRHHKYTLEFSGRSRLTAGSRLRAIRIDPMPGPGAAWIREVKIYQGTKLDG